MQGQADPAYTVSELAEMWNVHNRTVLRAIADGRLPAFRVGRDWRVKACEVTKIESQQPQRQTLR